ncbi:TPA: helix-turn-helix transcriptional regulator [Klebsiella aerogenes]
MNGKKYGCDVKNEPTYNIPLVIDENVISSGISLISLWHTLADDRYQVVWPRDKKKPLIENSWVAIYTLQGAGEIILHDGAILTLTGNCVIFLKPTDIASYCCKGLLWEQYWMEFIPTGAMTIPLSQPAVIYQGNEYNKELVYVTTLISSDQELNKRLAVACITRMIYQWTSLISGSRQQDINLRKIEKLLSEFHTNIQKDWTVEYMATRLHCSEQHLRRLFLKYTRKTPKQYCLDARLNMALSLMNQGDHSVNQVADMLNFFDTFHFSKAFKKKFGFCPSSLKK